MKILIVDDIPDIRESLRNIIHIKIDDSYEIKEAENGLEALGIVDSFEPDIVLTDVMMPKMDGIRLTALLKSQPQTQHIFVAAITGLSTREDIDEIYESGVDFYIAKPFQIDDITARLKVITTLIDNKDGLNESITNEKPTIIYNTFQDDTIKHYYITFSILHEDDIFLLFDYFSNKNVVYNSILLKDFMVTLLKVSKKMDYNKAFDLIVEESDKFLYVTIQEHCFISAMDELEKTKTVSSQYKIDEDTVSFRIEMYKDTVKGL